MLHWIIGSSAKFRLIERCQRIEREEGVAFGPDFVLRAAQERFDATL